MKPATWAEDKPVNCAAVSPATCAVDSSVHRPDALNWINCATVNCPILVGLSDPSMPVAKDASLTGSIAANAALLMPANWLALKFAKKAAC